MQDIGPEMTFNADHSGISYETHSGRTEEFVGARHVEASTQSKHAMTYSCTYFPMVSARGVLQEPFLLITQEPKAGEFGPRADVLRPPNVQVVASKSGKMTKEILLDWVQFVYNDSVAENPNSFLIVDSWSGFKSRSASLTDTSS